MKKIDYEKIIENLSFVYDKRGRAGHDEFFFSLKNELDNSSYQILNKVIIEDYLMKRGVNDRLFGAFPKGDIINLTKKCQELESSSNILLR